MARGEACANSLLMLLPSWPSLSPLSFANIHPPDAFLIGKLVRCL
jgi:hypothetical protein